MSSYMSNQIIVGNLGRNPEMRYTPEGQPVTDFSVAVNRQYTNKAGETVKDVVWFRVASWGKQAEVVNQYLKKGSKVLVEGRLVYDPATGGPRIWTNQSGDPQASFELVSQTVRFLDSKGNGGESNIPASAPPAAPEEDIPF
ncbi:MAG: single-stranded DNA-binding protein [Anaerolineae bacterium]|nr:single-stranded DNA-binding protein [Anaerolineae bacterium]